MFLEQHRCQKQDRKIQAFVYIYILGDYELVEIVWPRGLENALN